MEYFTLANGRKLPAIGSGTNSFGKEKDNFRSAIINDWAPIYSAVEVGYELFDTAISYGNEQGVGAALHDTGISRDRLCLLAKLPAPAADVSDVRQYTMDCVKRSLLHFQTDYLDLYLIHKPWEDQAGMVAMWQTLLELSTQGLIHSPGVSNFSTEQIQMLYEATGVYPQVNQIQVNPRCWNDELVQSCQDKDIRPIAWAPLTGASDSFKAVLADIGKPYQKSWVQVLLRFDYQRGICAIPKSHVREEQEQNLDIFDFILSDEDMAVIHRVRAS